MNRKTDAVDIIVPVYNGYEDLQRCIPSIKKHTDLVKHRLVLINDCSPDERIRPYLDSFADEHTLVLHNERNLGFSGNVNKGMALSQDRDVLLLNADTVVTAGWLDKIVACAYRDESIATVTPLSNSATLCSVPVMCQDNPLPEGLTIDEYAALIERCSLRRYPRITVAVGFCMFIKRCVIDDIGGFDAETFGRGYGEENDFCNRAEQAGYHHVMCDDTFVYHKGTASFDTAEKQALLDAHTAILEERYPEQMRANHLYCMENPDQEIRDNIILYTKLHNGKKNLLYFLHLDFREHAFNSIGGTQIHVRELTEGLRDEYNVFVMARDDDVLCVTAYTDREEILLKFQIGEAPKFPLFHNKEIRKICEQVLRAFSIDLIHVHHTQDLSLEIYDAAHALGIPIIATMHDYYYACPTILLLDGRGNFCAPQDASLTDEERRERCAACLWKKKGIVPQEDYLKLWRREHGKALHMCRELIFPSESARNIFLQYFPDLDNCRVIEHGEDKLEREVTHVPSPEGAMRNPKLKVRLDRVLSAEQGLNDIEGWAYLEGVSNSETEIFVELVDAGGRKDCFLVHKKARPDIVDSFGDPDALMCGINLRVSSEVLADGPVKVNVYVKHAGKVYTDGKGAKSVYRRRFGREGRLNVAFLGGMVPQKGSLMALGLIPLDKTQINWFVLGVIGDKRVGEIRQDNCFFSSTYKKEELPQLLSDNEIDVVCIPPVWPETFCYTVSEAWMNGIPVLGTDIGAVGERIRKTGGGWLVSSDAMPEEVLELLHRIKNDPEDYAQKKAAVAQIKLKSVAEMCGEYRALYAELLGKEENIPNTESAQESGSVQTDEIISDDGPVQKGGSVCGEKRDAEVECAGKQRTGEAGYGEVDYDFIFQGLALANPAVAGRGGIAEMNRLRQQNAALKSSIEVMKGTSAYRVARKIADANIPFKEQIKKQAKKVLQKK